MVPGMPLFGAAGGLCLRMLPSPSDMIQLLPTVSHPVGDRGGGSWY
jgi:hypothetical protein